MTGRMRNWAAPAFLFACLLLGGSSRLLWPSLVLQLLGILLILWAAAGPRHEPLARAPRYLLAIVLGALILVLIQLVPLPPGLWRTLPGRQVVETGLETLGFDFPWLPLSLAPYRTLESAYGLVPPVAVIAALLARGAHSERWIAGAVILGALASIMLAALQIASGGPPSWPYFYDVTSPGAVGAFANRNHMATLLLAAIPFAAALLAEGRQQARRRETKLAMVTVGAVSFVVILVGLVLNRSLAALLLVVPVVALSALLLPIGWRLRPILVPCAGLALLVSVAALANSSIGGGIAVSSELGSLYSRSHIWTLTSRAVLGSFPLGTGLGTFPGVYVMLEDPSSVDGTYVNHAHNDYLELLLETGLPGLFLMLAFLLWYGWQTLRVWALSFDSLFAKAASIASAAILAHSTVDYPLRTSAIAALLGGCLAILAQSKRQGRSAEARHVRID